MQAFELKIKLNGIEYTVEVEKVEKNKAAAVRPSSPAAAAVTQTSAPTPAPAVTKQQPQQTASVQAGETPVQAPLPGKVIRVQAAVGTQVQKGDVLMLLEAMKMQNEIGAPVSGTVKSITVSAGQNVKPGEVLAVIG